MEVKLTRVTYNPVDAIEEAACNCYDSEPTGGKIMKSCYRSGHHSVLEFANFTFHIEGVSRALLAQLTRHRHAGYAVRSQRYCSENGFDYVVPRTIREDEATYLEYINLMNHISSFYEYAQEREIPNEDARYALPNACETTLEFTCNGRELIHIMNERLCTRAQWEIRNLCTLMKKCVEEYDDQCAMFAEFLKPKCATLEYCPEHSSCGAYPKKHKVLNDYNKYKEVRDMTNRMRNGYYNNTEEIVAEFILRFCEDEN